MMEYPVFTSLILFVRLMTAFLIIGRAAPHCAAYSCLFWHTLAGLERYCVCVKAEEIMWSVEEMSSSVHTAMAITERERVYVVQI